ncbi:MAG: alpha/beta hydrolase [Chloroflexi bacterium]|nr:alpha/beta hydrolase [Chloroflexota bacterium]
MRFWENQGVRIAYETHGTTGPWVVLVHGGGLDRRMWQPQVPVLARRWRVLTYDQRGQGESDAPLTGYGPDDHLADLAGLIAAVGIERLHVIGLSLGSAIAQAYAVTHPERVLSLVLAGGSATPTPPDPAFTAHLQRLEALMAAGDRAGALRANLEGPLIGQSKGRPNWPLIEQIILSQRLPQLHDPQRGRYPPPRLDPAQQLAALTMPVLVIDGANDLPGILARGAYLERTLPTVRRVIIPDAGHLVNLDQPERFNVVVLAFLETGSTAAAKT